MTLFTIDIVLRLPGSLREVALSDSARLVERMRKQGHLSTFQLGYPRVADPHGGICEPHVSLFMLAVEEAEIAPVLAALNGLTATVSAVQAVAQEWRHNPQGAPELHFQPSPQWNALQQAVLGATEPLRRRRLRDTDPAGANLVDVVYRLQQEDPDGQQLRQLLCYGYDEITDDAAARFHPHVTVAWPVDGFPISLDGLTASSWSGLLTELAVYGMTPNGTCTTLFGSVSLRSDPNPNQNPNLSQPVPLR